MVVEFHHGVATAAPSIGFARVFLSLSQRNVTERGHDLMRRTAGIGEAPT